MNQFLFLFFSIGLICVSCQVVELKDNRIQNVKLVEGGGLLGTKGYQYASPPIEASENGVYTWKSTISTSGIKRGNEAWTFFVSLYEPGLTKFSNIKMSDLTEINAYYVITDDVGKNVVSFKSSLEKWNGYVNVENNVQAQRIFPDYILNKEVKSEYKSGGVLFYPEKNKIYNLKFVLDTSKCKFYNQNNNICIIELQRGGVK